MLSTFRKVGFCVLNLVVICMLLLFSGLTCAAVATLLTTTVPLAGIVVTMLFACCAFAMLVSLVNLNS